MPTENRYTLACIRPITIGAQNNGVKALTL